MSDEPDVTVKTLHRKKKPVLLEDIQGNPLPRSSTGSGQAKDLARQDVTWTRPGPKD